MHPRQSSVLLFVALVLGLALLSVGLLHASIESANQATNPEPFYAEYAVQSYSPPMAPLSDEEIAKCMKRLRKEFLAKGLPERVADQQARRYASAFNETLGGSRELTLYFGAGKGCVLHARYEKAQHEKLDTDVRSMVPEGFVAWAIVKPDRESKWYGSMKKNGIAYPILSILPINREKPPKKAGFKAQAAILGFEPFASLFAGVPTATSGPEGDTVLEFVVPAGERNAGRRQAVILDSQGRIRSIAYKDAITTINPWNELWTASDYVRANKGWVPKTMTRRLHTGKTLRNSIDYKLTKLEIGLPVLKRWFTDGVREPTLVEDSRYHGVTVHYFTKDKLLSDEEVERRAKILASRQQPMWRLKSPWKVVGTGLILLGAVLLIRKLGWPRKRSKEE